MRSKKLLTIPILAFALVMAMAGCTSPSGDASSSSGPVFSTGNAAYDAVINAALVADDATIQANAWAKAIKDAGVLKIGGVQTSTLFSLLDPTTNKLVGFDAGLSQMLAKYILGDASKTDVTIITSATRETVLTSKAVDAVFATYSITTARMQTVAFAGPYYNSQAGILVSKSNTTITSLADLAGKKVATQAGSTGVSLLQTSAPQAQVVELPDNAQCLAAVRAGQVDAYVIDEALLLDTLVQDSDSYKIVGDPFGPVDAYGIGLNKDGDAKAFVNDWLAKIEANGQWLDLWKATISAKTGVTSAPTPPAIGSAGN